MKNWIYWPEAGGRDINFVGYNRAVALLRRALGDTISPIDCGNHRLRLYCNIPWHHDPASLKTSGLPLVAYTMFESTRLPAAWSAFLNRHCAAVIVPSQFCADAFRMSGVRRPIKVAHLGIDPSDSRFVPVRPHDGYAYLWQGHTYDPNGRKAAGAVERAFKELRSLGRIGEDAKLILKYRPHHDFRFEVDGVELSPGITHIGRTTSAAEMTDLMARVDCCVNPSRGEGFGFIPLEQMAAGRPVIITNWSFPYIDSRYCLPVKYQLAKSPVTWCFKHLAIGSWGCEWNLGRKCHYHRLPALLPRASNGCLEVGPGGKRTQAKRSFVGTVRNLLSDAHRASGLYFRPTGHNKSLMLEHPGYDASVDIEDLKNKMEWCYNNREKTARLGAWASEYARERWNLSRVREEFLTALSELKSEGVI